jgi:hypothetical protein
MAIGMKCPACPHAVPGVYLLEAEKNRADIVQNAPPLVAWEPERV